MRLVSGIAILLTLGIVGDAKTTQPNSMESIEGETVHLPCSHSTIGGNEYIHWYRQVPLRSPEYVIHGLQQNTSNGMAFLAIPSDRKSSTLILPHVSLGDAAVYHCILRVAHCDRQGCTCAKSAWWGRGSSGLFSKGLCTGVSRNCWRK
ncbi:Ig lambda chain V-IV region Hil [Sigmodon hispidus]